MQCRPAGGSYLFAAGAFTLGTFALGANAFAMFAFHALAMLGFHPLTVLGFHPLAVAFGMRAVALAKFVHFATQ